MKVGLFGLRGLFGLICVFCAVASANARPLEKGMSGEDVRRWQIFLIGQGYMKPPALGNFSDRTLTATIAFQKSNGLQGLGIVGDKTLAVAHRLGFGGHNSAPVAPLPSETSAGSRQPVWRAPADDSEFVAPKTAPAKRTFSGRTDMAAWYTDFAAQNDKLRADYSYHRRAGHKRWCAGYHDLPPFYIPVFSLVLPPAC